jgi:O-antigen ligase
MIKKNPVLGVGLNNATQVVHKYAAETPLIANAEGYVWVFIVHNQFLLVASETGVPGLIAFLAVIGIALRAAVACMRARDPVLSETGAILTTSIVALIWALNLDHVAGAQTYILLWFIMSFAIGLRNVVQADLARKGSDQHRWHPFYSYYEAYNGATETGSPRLVDAYSDSAGKFGASR